MNQLYIIGNGFDLAHGLKTSYTDFILWYINDACQKANEKKHFFDFLFEINLSSTKFPKFKSIKEFDDFRKENKDVLKLKIKNDFIQRLIELSVEPNWVDIEYEYYRHLIIQYRNYTKAPEADHSLTLGLVRDLNYGFTHIKTKLTEYLTNEINEAMMDDEILHHFQQQRPRNLRQQPKIMLLVFNYTDTVELYMNNLKHLNPQVIYIHGKLNDLKNPIIFGYGDELDPNYGNLENLNRNCFLDNIKSFWYFKTKNLQLLNSFLQSTSFNVNIMGHSCGISDRILLNSIFEHQHCNKIKIYYYDKGAEDNDFFEKTQEISRHFKQESKNIMRTRILSFYQCEPLKKSN